MKELQRAKDQQLTIQRGRLSLHDQGTRQAVHLNSSYLALTQPNLPTRGSPGNDHL